MREDARHFEGHFVGIHFVEAAVHDLHFDINDLIAGINAALAGFFDAVNDGRDVFLGNGAADDLVENFDAFAAGWAATLTQAWPYWPRPPDCLIYLPSPSAAPVTVSR